MRLRDAARVIRSKNAGPTQVTIDLMFDDPKLYARALNAASLRPAVIAQRYGVAEAEVFPYPAANAIKIVLPRRVIAGAPGDTDVYGAQQHRPMVDAEI
jgi:predicted RNase H-like nuclease